MTRSSRARIEHWTTAIHLEAWRAPRKLSTHLTAAKRARVTLTEVDEHGENTPTFLLVRGLERTAP
jgi:hypothetical protein